LEHLERTLEERSNRFEEVHRYLGNGAKIISSEMARETAMGVSILEAFNLLKEGGRLLRPL